MYIHCVPSSNCYQQTHSYSTPLSAAHSKLSGGAAAAAAAGVAGAVVAAPAAAAAAAAALLFSSAPLDSTVSLKVVAVAPML
jgi:hypothetical protein